MLARAAAEEKSRSRNLRSALESHSIFTMEIFPLSGWVPTAVLGTTSFPTLNEHWTWLNLGNLVFLDVRGFPPAARAATWRIQFSISTWSNIYAATMFTLKSMKDVLKRNMDRTSRAVNKSAGDRASSSRNWLLMISVCDGFRSECIDMKCFVESFRLSTSSKFKTQIISYMLRSFPQITCLENDPALDIKFPNPFRLRNF